MFDPRAYRSNFDRKAMDYYLTSKNEFNAMVKEHKYEIKGIRDKDKEYRDNYMKSFIHRSEFETKTLTLFKNNTMILNSNLEKKKVKPKLKTIV